MVAHRAVAAEIVSLFDGAYANAGCAAFFCAQIQDGAFG